MTSFYDLLTNYLPLVLFVLTISIHLVFALAVYFDAVELEKRLLHVFVGAPAWALAVVVFGLFAVLIYWLMHHSALRRSYSSETKLFDKELQHDESKNHVNNKMN